MLHGLSVVLGRLIRLVLSVLRHEVVVYAGVDLRFFRLVHHRVLDVYIVNHFLGLNVVVHRDRLLVLVEYVGDIRFWLLLRS